VLRKRGEEGQNTDFSNDKNREMKDDLRYLSRKDVEKMD
jgi:hypothetical protein